MSHSTMVTRFWKEHSDDYVLEKARFVEWLATPKAVRKPSTQERLAHELNVLPPTLSTWKRDPAILRARDELIRLSIKDVLPDVVRGIAKVAVGGGTPQARLLFELAGWLDKDKDIDRGGLKIEIQYTDGGQIDHLALPAPRITLPGTTIKDVAARIDTSIDTDTDNGSNSIYDN